MDLFDFMIMSMLANEFVNALSRDGGSQNSSSTELNEEIIPNWLFSNQDVPGFQMRIPLNTLVPLPEGRSRYRIKNGRNGTRLINAIIKYRR